MKIKKILLWTLPCIFILFSYFYFNNSNSYDIDIRSRVFLESRYLKDKGYRPDIYRLMNGYGDITVNNTPLKLGKVEYFITYPIYKNDTTGQPVRRFVIYIQSNLEKKYESNIQSITIDTVDNKSFSGCYKISSEDICNSNNDSLNNNYSNHLPKSMDIDSYSSLPIFEKHNFNISYVGKSFGGLVYSAGGDIIEHIQCYSY